MNRAFKLCALTIFLVGIILGGWTLFNRLRHRAEEVGPSPGAPLTTLTARPTMPSLPGVAEAASASIQGLVKFSSGTLSPDGLVVTARSQGKTFDAACSPSGEFRLEGLAPGSWSVVVRGPLLFEPFEDRIDLQAGEQELSITLKPFGRLLATLFDERSRRALAGLGVHIERVDGQRPDRHSATTDAHGIATLDGLAGGQYRIQFGSFGLSEVHPPQEVPVPVGEETRFEVAVRPGVDGHVFSPEHLPVSDASVTCSLDGRVLQTAMTDGHGLFQFHGLFGTPKIMVAAGKESLQSPPQGPFLVPQEGIHNLELVLTRPCLIAGHVVDSNRDMLQGITVYSKALPELKVVTGDDGAFELQPLPVGLHELCLQAPDQPRPFVHPEGRILLESGQSLTGVTLIYDMQQFGSISGFVTAEDGSPIEATVSAIPVEPQDPNGTGLTDTNGYYLITHLPRVNYRLKVLPVSPWVAPEPKSIIPPAEEVNFELTAGCTLKGRVVDSQTQQPVESFRFYHQTARDVRLTDEELLGTASSFFESVASPEGEFEILLDPAAVPVEVVVMAEGYALTRRQFGCPSRPEEIAVIPLQQTHGVEGIVVDSAETPVEFASVYVGRLPRGSSGISQGYHALSDREGRFVLHGLSDGTVTLYAMHAVKGTGSAEAHVDQGVAANAPVRIKLLPGGAVYGVVTFDGEPLSGARVQVQSITNSAGEYEVTDLAPGPLELEILPNPNIEGYNFVIHKSVEVLSSARTECNIDIHSGTAILRGRPIVTGETTAPGVAILEIDTGSYKETHRTGPDGTGNFTFEQAPSGTGVLKIRLMEVDSQAVRFDEAIQLRPGELLELEMHIAP